MSSRHIGDGNREAGSRSSRAPLRLVGGCVGLAGLLLVGGSGASWAANPPDKSTFFAGDASSALAVSPDGRVVASLNPSGSVRIFDAYSTTSFQDSDVGASVPLTGCADPKSVFVSSNWRVAVPCGSSKTVQWFPVQVNSESTEAAPLLVGSPASIAVALDTMTATTFDPDSGTLYLAGTVTGDSQQSLVSLDIASSLTPVPFSPLGLTTQISAMAVQVNGSLLLVDSTARLYGVVGGVLAQAPGGASCTGATPRRVLALSAEKAILLGGSAEVFEIDLGSSTPAACEARDWGLSTPPTDAAVLTHAGTEYLYVRGGTSTGEDVVVYAMSSVLASHTSLSPDGDTSTDTDTPAETGVLAASPLGLVFLGTSSGVALLSSGPTPVISNLSEPALLTEDDDGLSLTLSIDETATLLWWDDAPPGSSSTPGSTNITGAPAGGSSATVTLDLSSASLETGLNTLFLYANDSDGNQGWTSLRVRYVETPDGLENFDVRFGDQALYLYFDAPTDEEIDGYEVLIALEPFTTSVDSTDLPADFDEEDTFIVGSTTYPVGGEWPMSLEASTDTTVWSESEEGQLVYRLAPLTNRTTYYVAIRATIGGAVVGSWSEVLTGVPEPTCGAACLAEEAGGFCRYAPESSAAPRATWFLALALGSIAVRRRFRFNGGSSSARARGSF